MLVMFFFRHGFSEFPRPIALKLCHLIGTCVYLIMQVQKLGGHSPKKIRGPKTCKISVDFQGRLSPPTAMALFPPNSHVSPPLFCPPPPPPPQTIFGHFVRNFVQFYAFSVNFVSWQSEIMTPKNKKKYKWGW